MSQWKRLHYCIMLKNRYFWVALVLQYYLASIKPPLISKTTCTVDEISCLGFVCAGIVFWSGTRSSIEYIEGSRISGSTRPKQSEYVKLWQENGELSPSAALQRVKSCRYSYMERSLLSGLSSRIVGGVFRALVIELGALVENNYPRVLFDRPKSQPNTATQIFYRLSRRAYSIRNSTPRIETELVNKAPLNLSHKPIGGMNTEGNLCPALIETANRRQHLLIENHAKDQFSETNISDRKIAAPQIEMRTKRSYWRSREGYVCKKIINTKTCFLLPQSPFFQ